LKAKRRNLSAAKYVSSRQVSDLISQETKAREIPWVVDYHSSAKVHFLSKTTAATFASRFPSIIDVKQPIMFPQPVGTILLLTAWVALLEPASLAEERFEPQFHPSLEVRPLQGQIKIDGELNDTGWLNAARVNGFSEITPDNLARPPAETEVLLAYDEKQLYLAFLAEDRDPAAIRSSLCDRDEMYDDDYVGVLIDPYGDAALAFELMSNPIGVQGDGIQSLGTEDISFDLVFQSAGKITEKGYQVEMAIPFNSLRFPDRPSQLWRATFFRTHPRQSRRQYSWAAVDLDDPCLLCQLGTLTGIHNVRPGGRWSFCPP
jgi:hypothetical protein